MKESWQTPYLAAPSPRRIKRAAQKSVGMLESSKPHARLKRGKSGHAEHWLAKERRLRTLREALSGISTESMVEECPEMRYVARTYPDALALSTAVYADLLRLNGVGPRRLRRIRGYLLKNNVPVSWKVPD